MEKRKTRKKEELQIILFILTAFVASRAIMYLIYCYKTGGSGLISSIQYFNSWDANWYLAYIDGFNTGNMTVDVASGQATWAFFPLYPLCVFAVWKLLGGIFDPGVVGAVMSMVFFGIAEYYAYKYVKLTRGSVKMAYEMIGFLSFGLYSFYFSVLYTESLFLLLLTMCFYYMKKENYIAMGICGALLSATRSVGILFVFVILTDQIMQYMKSRNKHSFIDFIVTTLKKEKLILGTCMVPAGLFGYMVYLSQTLGDGLAFVHVEKTWGRGYHGILRNLAAEVLDQFPPSYLGIAVGSFMMLLAYSVLRHRKFDEMIFPVLIFLMSTSSYVSSVPRYMIGSFTVILAFMDEYTKRNRIAKVFIAALIFGLEVLLINEWLNRNNLLC